jgi:hypothetical protein
MGNVWGTANPMVPPGVFTPSGDTSCPAGTNTSLFGTSSYSAPTPGSYYPFVWANLVFLCGATPPSALSVAMAIDNGSMVDTLIVAPALLVANATVNLPVVMVGPSSSTQWLGAGTWVYLFFNPTGQAVTFKFAGSRVVVALFRGPDS